MYQYRSLTTCDAEKIAELNPEWFIHKAWRNVNGNLTLVDINYLETDFPNGLSWHQEQMITSLHKGGRAVGCFLQNKMVGFGVMNADKFGHDNEYVLLDQLFISKEERGHGIGKTLFHMICQNAIELGAKKLYICAASAEETIAFYRSVGCKDASEVNQTLYELDPRDLQLEYTL